MTVDTELANDMSWSAETKYFDCGKPHMVKSFLRVIVRYTSPQPITFSYDIDQTGYTAIANALPASGTFTWGGSNTSWRDTGDANDTDGHIWNSTIVSETVVQLPQNLIGRRISFKFNGTAHLPGTEIQGLYIVYSPEARIQ